MMKKHLLINWWSSFSWFTWYNGISLPRWEYTHNNASVALKIGSAIADLWLAYLPIKRYFSLLQPSLCFCSGTSLLLCSLVQDKQRVEVIQAEVYSSPLSSELQLFFAWEWPAWGMPGPPWDSSCHCFRIWRHGFGCQFCHSRITRSVTFVQRLLGRLLQCKQCSQRLLFRFGLSPVRTVYCLKSPLLAGQTVWRWWMGSIPIRRHLSLIWSLQQSKMRTCWMSASTTAMT